MRRSSPDYEDHFSVEDCDALLEFPYHEYNLKIKQEVPEVQSCDSGTSNAASAELAVCEKTPVIEQNNVPVSDFKSVQLTLSKNQLCQRKMVQCLNKIQKALKACYEKKELEQSVSKEGDKSLNSMKDEQSDIKPISLFAAPYFRDVRGMVPPDNEDTISKKKNNEVNAYLIPPRPWTRTENKKLLNGVASSALCQVLKPLKLKRNFLKSKLKNQNLLEFELDVIKNQIALIEKKIKHVNEKPIMECLEESKEKIDWMTIAATNMEGTRSAEECENMWNNYLNVSVNKGPFTAEEDSQLKELAEKYNERDWDTIADLLQTNRTAIQCFERYQTKININITRKFWTKEEDEHLENIIESVKVGDVIPWNKVCCYMEGRTRAQVMNRYERSVSKQISRTPWTNKEDAMLIACVKKIGYMWGKMKPFFQGRNAYACRERYMNTLDPSLKIGGWSKAEDIMLINSIKEYGYGKWSKICKHLPGRTDNMCLMRAQRLKLHSARKSKKKLKPDEDVDDPEVITKILKPIAPTKVCEVQNLRLQNTRQSALNVLLTVLKKIQPSIKYEADLEKLDLSSAGPNILHQIYGELSKLKSEQESVSSRPRYKRNNTLRIKGERKYLNEDDIPYADESEDSLSLDNEDDVLVSEELEENVNEEQKLQFNKILDSMFEISGCMLYAHLSKKFVALNARAAAEQSLYKSFLYQNFNCANKYDENEDIENVTFAGVDYGISLGDIVYHFIQPAVYEDQFIVLAPNLTTLDGMDTLMATKERLQLMSKFVQHSKSNLNYLTGNSENFHKCLHCQQTNEKSNFMEDLDPVRKLIEQDNFVVDEIMENALFSEYADPAKIGDKCVCNEMLEARDSISLLRQRFFSLFLWPELLATSGFSEQQNLIISEDSSTRIHTTDSSTIKKAKRGRPKGFKIEKNELEDGKVAVRKVGRPKGSKNKSSISQDQNSSRNELTPFKRPADGSPNVTPVRRSKRSCVLQRKSFTNFEFE